MKNDMGRIVYFDYIRVFSMFFIVLMHSPFKDNPGINSYVMSAISFYTAPSIGLFFMISGALLLRETYSTKDFLKKRFKKIIPPIIIFTILDLYVHNSLDIEKILSIPFNSQGIYGTLWFMYVIAGLYLLTPILSKWINNITRRELEFYLILWVITMTYPLLENWLSVSGGIYSVSYYFTGFVGYYLLGYYLDKFVNVKNKTLIMLFFIICAILVLIKLYHIEIDFYKYFCYLSVQVMAISIIYFCFFKNISLPKSNLITQTSKLSMGIYLIHIFIIRAIIKKIAFFNEINSIYQIILTTILSFFISLVLSWLLSKSKYTKFIIGL